MSKRLSSRCREKCVATLVEPEKAGIRLTDPDSRNAVWHATGQLHLPRRPLEARSPGRCTLRVAAVQDAEWPDSHCLAGFVDIGFGGEDDPDLKHPGEPHSANR